MMISLTFDSDHVDEARMVEFLGDIEIPGTATFFCTQEYRCLEGTLHELCPHPFLGAGMEWRLELERMREMYPKAEGWRSHSCVFSHLLAEWLASNGYRYVSTNDQFGQKGIRPVRHSWGIWHIPIFYMDNMDFSSVCFWKGKLDGPFSDNVIDIALSGDGVYVFDFHPIHLLLNTPTRDHYFTLRERFKAGEDYRDLTHKGFGTLSFYTRLCEAMKRNGLKSLTLKQTLDAYTALPI